MVTVGFLPGWVWVSAAILDSACVPMVHWLCILLLPVEVLLGWVAAASTGFSLCLSCFPVCCCWQWRSCRVSCCSSTGFSLCLQLVLVPSVCCCWQWRSCCGVFLYQYWIHLMSQLIPYVLLLAVEVLLGWLAAGVLLDSACVSAGSLSVVADSWGPARVSCCSSTGFSLCLSWLPVYNCCWQ